MSHFIILILISLLTVSCNDNTSPCIPGTEASQEIITLTFDDFRSHPERYHGKFVKVVGTKPVNPCRIGVHTGFLINIMN